MFFTNFFDRLNRLFSNDIGIDLGTANTVVNVKGLGIVLREPSVIALKGDRGNTRVDAVGMDAKLMIGRTPGSITAVRPLKDGVITEFYEAEFMLRHFIKKAMAKRGRRKPNVLVAIPSGITEIEREAVKKSALTAGARKVMFIDEPMAAAIGVGLPVTSPTGTMIVDIGGGTTEVAIISLADIVVRTSVKCAGDKLDEAIISYLRRQFNLIIGERTAEEIKIRIGSAYPLDEELSMDVKGRDVGEGLPATVTVTSEEIREAIAKPLKEIVDSVITTLDTCPPELAADLVDQGIVLAGGGALLRGLDQLIKGTTRLPVYVGEDPLSAVAEGTGKVLSDPELREKVITRA